VRRRIGVVLTAPLLAAALLAAQALPAPVPVHAATKRQLQQKLQHERTTLKQERQKLSEVNGQYSHTLASLKVVKEQLTVTQSRMVALSRQTALVRAKEAVTKTQLAATRKKLRADRSTVSGALEAFQAQGPGGFLNVLLSSQSLQDFIQRVSLVSQLMQSDMRVLDRISADQDRLDALSTRLKDQNRHLTRLQAAAEADARSLSTEKATLASDVQLLSTEKDTTQKAIVTAEGNETLLQNEIKALESSGTGQDIGSISFIWPVHGPITSPFGMRFDPVYQRWQLHAGIDIGVPVGTPIHAAAAGTVILASWVTGWGYVVEVDSGDGIVTLYAHESSIASSVGENVSQGDVIGYSGATGAVTGPNLHFGLYLGGNPVNPLPYLPPGGNE